MRGNDRGYPLAGYGEMIEDQGRMQPYVAALRKAIRPNCVVLDIGAGTGIFTLIACQLGAGRVIAVEPNPAIQVAREMIAANGWSDRVRCIEGYSTDLVLPERADVIVSDLRGVLPLFAQHLPSIIDARERLLAPGGVMIPQRDRLWAAPVESPKAYQRIERPWRTNDHGLDLSAARRFETNRWNRHVFKPEQLLAPGQAWLELDYRTVTHHDGSGTVRWSIARAGILHGLAVWFDAELAEGVGFSNAPGNPRLIYKQAFFPLPEPVTVNCGDQIEATLGAHRIGREHMEYIWRWRGVVSAADSTTVKARFDQSTFAGTLTSARARHRHRDDFVPQLTPDLEIDRFILARIDGATPLDELASALCEAYPHRFGQRGVARERVIDMLCRYTDDQQD